MDIYHVYDISVRWWRWLWQRNLSVSCNLSSRGCFDNPVFGDGGIFNVYICCLSVFVADTYFYIRDMVYSLWRVSLENSLCTRWVHLDRYLSGSLEFGILRSLYGLRSSSTIFNKIVREKIHTYHACLRVLHSEYSNIVVAQIGTNSSPCARILPYPDVYHVLLYKTILHSVLRIVAIQCSHIIDHSYSPTLV